MNRKQNLPAFSLVIGRWKSDKLARHVRGRCILTVSSFFCCKHMHIFLSPILHVLFRATNSLFKNIRKIEQFKNTLRLKSPKN